MNEKKINKEKFMITLTIIDCFISNSQLETIKYSKIKENKIKILIKITNPKDNKDRQISSTVSLSIDQSNIIKFSNKEIIIL